jgi:tRNA pseudouridine55 synthase
MDIVLNLNKPRDISSQDAVSKAKKIMKVKKAGHTGTLDPSATGVLLVCLNKATRLASYFSALDKEYRVVMKLGEVTDTQDATGKVIERSEGIEVDNALIKDALRSFEGKTIQHPPMFSALKHKGTPLYKYARKGIEIERKSREINIRHIELSDIELPYVTFSAVCSKGTYMRTLCNDIGKKLCVGAHLFALERTATGQFDIIDSLTLEELTDISKGQSIAKGVYTMDEALSWLPEFKINKLLTKPVTHGNPIKLNSFPEPSSELKAATGIRIKSTDGDLLAIGSYSADRNIIKMDVVFA